MAATNIQLIRENQFGSEIKALLNAYRKAVTDGPLILEAMSHMVDGDGTQEAHFTELVTLGIFPTTADAKASWAELQSANGKLTTDNSVTNVKTALLQVVAMHGVI